MPSNNESEMLRDRSIRLFTFLRELCLLRTTAVRDVCDYTNIIWFKDIPTESLSAPSIQCPPGTQEYETDSDVWIEVAQPEFCKYPDPPSELADWVIPAKLADSSENLPPLKDKLRIRSASALNTAGDETEFEYQLLSQSPEVSEQYARYLQNQWKSWATEDCRLRRIQSFYEALYDIYQIQQSKGESFELIIGFGLLCWQTKEAKVRRHMLTVKASVTFNPEHARLSLGPSLEDGSLRLEQEMLELADRPSGAELDCINSHVSSISEITWRKLDVESVLREWLHSASPRGQYYDTLDVPDSLGADPVIHFAPAVILRERTERNFVRVFDDIINQLTTGSEVPLGVERLVSIVDDSHASTDTVTGATESYRNGDTEIYFPLPANSAQSEIADRLRTRQGVLVQGPPGTGKSHTIVNLVCHLLAQGKRVLVTSHTPRALKVLRDKFPEELRALCVSVVGEDSAEAMMGLEESVKGITNRHHTWNHLQNKSEISELRAELDEVRRDEAWHLNALRAGREEDTVKHVNLFNRYSGTTQEIAQQLADEAGIYDWIKDRPQSGHTVPLSEDKMHQLLVLLRKSMTYDREEANKYLIEEEHLPSTEEFEQLVKDLQDSKKLLEKFESLKTHDAFMACSNVDRETRDRILEKIALIQSTHSRILNRRESWALRMSQEILADQDRHWREMLEVTKARLAHVEKDMRRLVEIQVAGLEGRDLPSVRVHAEELHIHLLRGGNLGFGPFKAKAVAAARYLISDVRVNGRGCDNVETTQELLDWIELQSTLISLQSLWSDLDGSAPSNPLSRIAHYMDLCEPVEDALLMHKMLSELRVVFANVPGMVEPIWYEPDSVKATEEAIRAIFCEELVQHNEIKLRDVERNLLATINRGDSHNVSNELLKAVQQRNIKKYSSLLSQLKGLHQRRREIIELTVLSDSVRTSAPKLWSELEMSAQQEVWDERLNQITRAWDWAGARRCIDRVSTRNNQSNLKAELDNCQSRIRQLLGSLAAHLAWGHCFERLTETERQYLVAWTKAVKRIGKGTGKNAPKYRLEARRSMEKCKSAVPAWIMPIHRVAEAVRPGQDAFDVVIVDEASQSGPEALFLQYIAKQLVVVGDEKQISPDFIGLKHDDVDRLRSRYLDDIPHADAIGVHHSFFEQAEIRYGGRIRLREHFRCMPEIIQFSNNISYASEPLIPLRQYGAGRLQPIMVRYIQDGYLSAVERPINVPEAEAIIAQIKSCIKDDAYNGKSIGVISLLSSSNQARYLEEKIKAQISANEIEERQLRVGDPYFFQGDERDIMFLSLVAAPTEGKKIGVMGSDKDRQRFNVAASRARDQMWLFHSIKAEELSPSCLRRAIIEYCNNPHTETTEVKGLRIEELRDRMRDRDPNSKPPAPFDSWFELDVFIRIIDRGYRVIPQYLMNGYRIDMIVEGLKGRLAVECDGDFWHGPDRFDHDLARQRDLERCGMQFWRIRGNAFYLNPDFALDGLWKTLERSQIFPSQTLTEKARSNTNTLSSTAAALP